jgi:hypothetical protein
VPEKLRFSCELGLTTEEKIRFRHCRKYTSKTLFFTLNFQIRCGNFQGLPEKHVFFGRRVYEYHAINPAYGKRGI